MMSFSKKSATKWLLNSALAFTLAVSLAGCSGADEETPELQKTSDASLTETADYVPASPNGPAENVPEPRLPVSATEKSHEGAQAATEYFWEAIDYGRLTGDTTKAELVSSASCDLCSDLISGWRSVYENDSWAALHGTMVLEVEDVEITAEDSSGQPVAEVSFSMTEPAVDFFKSGEFLEDESFDTESTADWWAQLTFDVTAERWKIEWIGLEDQVMEDHS